MLTTEQAMRLGRLQERVYRCIEDELREDGGHKSYEGAIDVTMSLPNIFSRGDAPTWTITLHAYVLTPMDGRHESWSAASLADALAIAEAGIAKICKHYEWRRFDREMSKMCDFDREMSKMCDFDREMSKMCDDECEIEGGTSYGANKHGAPTHG